MIFIPEIPNNSLKDELEEIVFLAKAAANSDVYEDELLTFEFNKPATEDELAAFEKELDVEFDEDYKDFLRFSNGAIICFNSAELYNIENIKALDAKEKDESLPDDYIIIADVIGDGEVLCYSRNKKKFISCFDEEWEYDSFSEFLNELIDRVRDKLVEYVEL